MSIFGILILMIAYYGIIKIRSVFNAENKEKIL